MKYIHFKNSPPIGLLTVYEMYGRSESEQTLSPGEQLPGRDPSMLSPSVRLGSGTDLPRRSCPIRVDLLFDADAA